MASAHYASMSFNLVEMDGVFKFGLLDVVYDGF
jgi:hypothetical protein